MNLSTTESFVNYDSSGSAYNSPTMPMSPQNVPFTSWVGNKAKGTVTDMFSFDGLYDQKCLSVENDLGFRETKEQESNLNYDRVPLINSTQWTINRCSSSLRRKPDFNPFIDQLLECRYYSYYNYSQRIQTHSSNLAPPDHSKNVRRSETINIAFAAVRNCIPNVSSDTKLSKIQTLRLAITYMRFLMSCLGDYRFLLLMSESDRKIYDGYIYTSPLLQPIYSLKRGERKRLSFSTKLS